MPGIGAAIQSLPDGKAKHNVEWRWLELFIELRKRIEEIRDQIPDEGFYGSEEFQTLLALAQEQLWTTHDRRKLHLLAVALANSGKAESRNDDKESMLRALRAMSSTDVKNLNHEYLRGWLPLTRHIEYPPEVLASLSSLASLGLVLDTLIRPNPNISEQEKLTALLKDGTRRTYQLSAFGHRFLAFIADGGDTSTPKAELG
jgi:hypothetical protein